MKPSTTTTAGRVLAVVLAACGLCAVAWWATNNPELKQPAGRASSTVLPYEARR